MRKDKNKNILNGILIFISICFAMPSMVYLINHKTVLNFNGNLEYCFLLTNHIDRLYQAGIFAILLLAFLLCYYFIIKNRKKIFTSTKQIYTLIIIISLVFAMIIPFLSSDIFYYLGIGRMTSTYKQNPYYIDMKSYIDNNAIEIQNDTVMQKGYQNYWANTTVVYGAFWTFICSILSFLSFGNLEVGLLIFKLINVIIHIGNCWLLYKISKKKIFPILYGLNPFILIEGISNVHNDMFVIFFILLSLYMLLKRKNIVLSILWLALATTIKYFSILLLPLIILHYCKDKDMKGRIIKCIQFGLLFAVFVAIPYLFYIRDIHVFAGIFAQRERIAKGVYLFISQYFTNPPNLVNIAKNIALSIFSIIYICKCISLLFTKTIKFSQEMRNLFIFMLVFLFLLITNFQPWYLIWLTPFMLWQKSDNIKLIIQMQIMTLIANIVFLIYSENYKYGVPFFTVFVIGTLICIIQNQRKRMMIKGVTK